MGNGGGYSQLKIAPLCHSFLLTLPLQQHGHSTDHSSFRKYPAAFCWEPPEIAVRISALAWFSPRAAEIYQLHQGVSSSCSETSALASVAPLPTPSLTLASTRWFSSLLSTSTASFATSYPCFPKGAHKWLRGSAVPCGGFIGADWNQLCPAWGSPDLLRQGPPCSPPHCQLLDTYTPPLQRSKKLTEP